MRAASGAGRNGGRLSAATPPARGQPLVKQALAKMEGLFEPDTA